MQCSRCSSVERRMDCCSLCTPGTSRGPFENLWVRASLHLQLRFIHPPPPMLVPLYRYNSKRVGTRWKGCTLHSLKISCRRIFRSLCLIFCVFSLFLFSLLFFTRYVRLSVLFSPLLSLSLFLFLQGKRGKITVVSTSSLHFEKRHELCDS